MAAYAFGLSQAIPQVSPSSSSTPSLASSSATHSATPSATPSNEATFSCPQLNKLDKILAMAQKQLQQKEESDSTDEYTKKLEKARPEIEMAMGLTHNDLNQQCSSHGKSDRSINLRRQTTVEDLLDTLLVSHPCSPMKSLVYWLIEKQLLSVCFLQFLTGTWY